MKFYNKKSKLRETWTKVEVTGYINRPELKRWCQNQPNKSRFFFRYFDYSSPWYFEDPEDAVYFKLRWGINGETKS